MEIPHGARAWYRFADNAGTVYEMNRMPMGLRTSAEIMQLVVETITGCIHAAVPRHANIKTTNDVWIDGFRIAGSSNNVQHALERVIETAKFVNATFKEQPRCATSYEFIGVEFNHAANDKHVRVAQKTRGKLPKSIDAKTTPKQLETTVARLIFAAGVLLIPLAQHYYAIKWVTRLAHSLRTGKRGVDDIIEVPMQTRKCIDKWLLQAQGKLEFTALTEMQLDSSASDILYTDASKFGWGAFLLLTTGEVAITGSKWPEGMDLSDSNINNFEAIAVAKATECFWDRLLPRKRVDFRIDNTSVTAAMGRALARTFGINNILAPTLQRLRDNNFSFTTTFVRSADNFADEPSRGIQTRAGVPPTHLSGGVVGRVAT